MQPKIQFIQGSKRFWRVTENQVFTLSTGDTVLIEKGFVFDLSTVPRFLWWLFPPYGDFLPAALLHDWLDVKKYKREELGTYKARLFIDGEMLKKSNELNKNKLDNYIRYYAVRLFGWLIYRGIIKSDRKKYES